MVRIAFAIMMSLLAGAAPSARAAEHPAYGPELEGFDYPYEVQCYALTSQGNYSDMARTFTLFGENSEPGKPKQSFKQVFKLEGGVGSLK